MFIEAPFNAWGADTAAVRECKSVPEEAFAPFPPFILWLWDLDYVNEDLRESAAEIAAICRQAFNDAPADPEIAYRLSAALLNAGDDLEALAILEKAAQSGMPKAEYLLGMLHISDRIPSASPEKGVEFLERAAEGDIFSASYALAKWHLTQAAQAGPGRAHLLDSIIWLCRASAHEEKIEAIYRKVGQDIGFSMALVFHELNSSERRQFSRREPEYYQWLEELLNR
jgi:TPR repeat protein